jgi:hypothetical protein
VLFCLLPLDFDFPVYASCVAENTGAKHHTWHFISSFFWQYWGLNLGVGARASRQVLFHLSHILSPFCFYYFSSGVLFCSTLLTMASSACHHTQLICWDGGLTKFLSGLASNRATPGICLLSSWDCRHTHYTWSKNTYWHLKGTYFRL